MTGSPPKFRKVTGSPPELPKPPEQPEQSDWQPEERVMLLGKTGACKFRSDMTAAKEILAEMHAEEPVLKVPTSAQETSVRGRVGLRMRSS